MELYAKISAFLVKFKDITTTIVGFIPLVYQIITTYQTWFAGGTGNIGTLLVAIVIAVVGWFTGKTNQAQ